MLPTIGMSITPINSSESPHCSATGSIAPTSTSLMITTPMVLATIQPTATGSRIVGAS
jgi:hypothetical protein